MRKLVQGFGINDVDYLTHITKNSSIIWRCPIYGYWSRMLERVFCKIKHSKNPTYIGTTICEEWKYLSKFREWVLNQPNRDWQNCELDKDLLVKGNKHYGPETVVYITSELNKFITDNKKTRGHCMIGVAYRPDKSRNNPYVAQCQNPFGLYKENGRWLGYYPTELEAHKVWQAKKHEYACLFAEQQEDPRVADALRQRYAPDKDWTTI